MTQPRPKHFTNLLRSFPASVAPVRTPVFVDEHGHVRPGSVATMETVMIGGTPQGLWFRGSSWENPVLVLLHGGPGGSLGALFRRYNAELERHSLVVIWEQRGAGRSYRRGIPRGSMTVAQFVRDLEARWAAHVGREQPQQIASVLDLMLNEHGHPWGRA